MCSSSQIEKAGSAGVHQPTNPQFIKHRDKMNTSWLLPTAIVIVTSLLFSVTNRLISVCSINHSSPFSLLKRMQLTLPGLKPVNFFAKCQHCCSARKRNRNSSLYAHIASNNNRFVLMALLLISLLLRLQALCMNHLKSLLQKFCWIRF